MSPVFRGGGGKSGGGLGVADKGAETVNRPSVLPTLASAPRPRLFCVPHSSPVRF